MQVLNRVFAVGLLLIGGWAATSAPLASGQGIDRKAKSKVAPVYPEGFDPKVVKLWLPKFDEYVKLHAAWVADWDKTFGYRQ